MDPAIALVVIAVIVIAIVIVIRKRSQNVPVQTQQPTPVVPKVPTPTPVVKTPPTPVVKTPPTPVVKTPPTPVVKTPAPAPVPSRVIAPTTIPTAPTEVSKHTVPIAPPPIRRGMPISHGMRRMYPMATEKTKESPASLTPSNTVNLKTRMSATLNDSQNQQKHASANFAKAVQAANVKNPSSAVLVTLYQTMATKARAHAQSCLPFAAALGAKIPSTTQTALAKALAAYTQCLAQETIALAATDPATAKTASFAAEHARFACSDALLDLMLLVNPPKNLHVPARHPSIVDCNAGNKTSWPNTDDARRLFPEQTRLVTYVQTKAQELLAYLLKNYPKDPLTVNMNKHWSRRVAPFDAINEIVKFTIGDSPWMLTNGCKFGKCIGMHMHLAGSPPRCLTRVIHELCHICTSADGQEGHTPKFYAAERKLLRIATEELGWIVENWRRETCDIAKDPNTTDPNKACPKCAWQEDPVFSSKEVSDATCRPKGEVVPTTDSTDPPATAAMMTPMSKKVAASMTTIQATTSKNPYVQKQIQRAQYASSQFQTVKLKDPQTAAAWNCIVQNAALTIGFLKTASSPPVYGYLPY